MIRKVLEFKPKKKKTEYMPENSVPTLMKPIFNLLIQCMIRNNSQSQVASFSNTKFIQDYEVIWLTWNMLEIVPWYIVWLTRFSHLAFEDMQILPPTMINWWYSKCYAQGKSSFSNKQVFQPCDYLSMSELNAWKREGEIKKESMNKTYHFSATIY